MYNLHTEAIHLAQYQQNFLGTACGYFQTTVKHSARVGLASYLLISSASTRTIRHRSIGLGLLPLAIAEWISCGIRSQGTWDVSGHVFSVWDVEGLLLGSLFLAWLEHDELADSCDEQELCGVHSDGNEDPGIGQSLLSGDEVGMTWKSNATVSVSKKQTKIELGHITNKLYQSHCRHLGKILLNSFY